MKAHVSLGTGKLKDLIPVLREHLDWCDPAPDKANEFTVFSTPHFDEVLADHRVVQVTIKIKV